MDAPVSLHQRIVSDIEANIVSGRWPPGTRIASEQELTAHYGCSRMTVNKALTQLARGGMIERRRKTGSFVMRPHSRSAVLEIQDIGAEVAALGRPYHYQIVERRRRRATRADAEALGRTGNAPVLRVETLHHAGPRPFCLEQRLIDLATVPGAAEQTFADEPPGSWLVHHVPWTSAEHRIRAAPADRASAPALQLRIGTPCLVVERRTWASGKPVTWVRLVYPGDGHELVARFSPSTAVKHSNETA